MTPLVLVHGFMGGSAQWAAQEPLAQGRELILVDLPGFGKNAHLPVLNRIGDFADWVLSFLADRGIRRFDLLGHSMGGMIVQEMICRAPERIDRLVLYGTGCIGELPGRFEPIETSKQRARDDGPVATARRISATWFRDGEKALGFAEFAAIAELSSLNAILAGLEAMQNWSGEANLDRIVARTLVIWGELDRTYPWSQTEALWRSVPNSSIAVVPDCAHAVHSEAPDLFNSLLERFLVK